MKEYCMVMNSSKLADHLKSHQTNNVGGQTTYETCGMSRKKTFVVFLFIKIFLVASSVSVEGQNHTEPFSEHCLNFWVPDRTHCDLRVPANKLKWAWVGQGL
jgi:hypothetical protein